MDREKLYWRSTADAGKAIAAAWNQPGTPLYYVLDLQGVIRYKWSGYPGEKALDTALENLIQEAERDVKNRRSRIAEPGAAPDRGGN